MAANHNSLNDHTAFSIETDGQTSIALALEAMLLEQEEKVSSTALLKEVDAAQAVLYSVLIRHGVKAATEANLANEAGNTVDNKRTTRWMGSAAVAAFRINGIK